MAIVVSFEESFSFGADHKNVAIRRISRLNYLGHATRYELFRPLFVEQYSVLQVPPDYLQMRVTVRPQGSMRLYARRDLPLVEARMAASATVELRQDTAMVSQGHVC